MAIIAVLLARFTSNLLVIIPDNVRGLSSSIHRISEYVEDAKKCVENMMGKALPGPRHYQVTSLMRSVADFRSLM
jgi:hypothetical protein